MISLAVSLVGLIFAIVFSKYLTRRQVVDNDTTDAVLADINQKGEYENKMSRRSGN